MRRDWEREEADGEDWEQEEAHADSPWPVLWVVLIVITGALALALSLFVPANASALEIHPDRRFVSHTCWTWGGGKYKAVRASVRARFMWSTNQSNYPTGMVVQGGCHYAGDTNPMPTGGEEVLLCENCYAKTVIPKGEILPRTSWPTLTIGVTHDFNEGWSFHQCWCKWDPWAYGGTPVSTTLPVPTTLVPATTTPTTTHHAGTTTTLSEW